jgi:lipopolysaccharide export system protein LptC
MVRQAAHPVSRLVGILVVVSVFACRNDLDRVAAVDVPVEAPDRVTSNAEYLYSDSGRVTNRLRAGRIEEYMNKEEPRTEIVDGLELLFYGGHGEEGSLLTARRGRIWPGEGRMQVNERVVFTNARGERLETEELIWEQDSDRVHTDRPVKITRQGDILYGQGLDAAEDFSHYTIRNVIGSFELPQDTLRP